MQQKLLKDLDKSLFLEGREKISDNINDDSNDSDIQIDADSEFFKINPQDNPKVKKLKLNNQNALQTLEIERLSDKNSELKGELQTLSEKNKFLNEEILMLKEQLKNNKYSFTCQCEKLKQECEDLHAELSQKSRQLHIVHELNYLLQIKFHEFFGK